MHDALALLVQGMREELRLDGRKPLDPRPVTFQVRHAETMSSMHPSQLYCPCTSAFSRLAQADGSSATVQLGSTSIAFGKRLTLH